MGRRERTAEQPDGEIERVFSGLRPGEKLFEKLLIGDDPHSLHGQALLPSRSHKRNKRMAQTYGGQALVLVRNPYFFLHCALVVEELHCVYA
ncbi:MAG: polysaccharide biosynthesis protein [Marinobacter sp.]|nr:polysaccharide biosynthesis protein [Marinobacter sp.]MCL1486697.1 polysaccharide biosynthesis protein [Marinobacter sp.]MCL1486702.1 polysaccharide biosynthesis protein [Marinobacter sp.]